LRKASASLAAFLILLCTCASVAIPQSNAPGPIYPLQYELLCPAGSSPISLISDGAASTFNASTGKWRANRCIDNNGNISENVSGNNTFTGANTFTIINNIVKVDQQSGADMCAKLTSAQTTLNGISARGGILDATGLVGAQSCASQFVVTSNVEILLNPALVLTCNTTTNPCITGTDVTYGIVGHHASTDSNTTGPSIVAGTSTGYLVEFKTATNGQNCKESVVEGVFFNGTTTSKGIHINNCLSVQITGDTFDNLVESVSIENTGTLFSETQNLVNNWFTNCKSICVNFILSGTNASFSNQKWDRNYFQMNSNATAINFPSTGQCGQCDLGSIKIWTGAGTTGVVGFKNRGDMTGSVMKLFMFEGGFGTSGAVGWDSTGSIEPTVTGFRVYPACGSFDMAATCVIHGNAWVSTNLPNIYGVSSSGRLSFAPGSGLATAGFGSCGAGATSLPGIDTFGDSGTGLFNIDQVNHQLAVGIQGCRTLFIGKNIMSFEPNGDGSRRVQIDSTGLTLPAVGGNATSLQLVEGANPNPATFAGQAAVGAKTDHFIYGNLNNTNNHKIFVGEAGSCAMSATTTCTFSIGAAFSGTPLTFASIDAASTVPATANSAKCAVSATTVTITAGISNSLTWDCLLIGNPD